MTESRRCPGDDHDTVVETEPIEGGLGGQVHGVGHGADTRSATDPAVERATAPLRLAIDRGTSVADAIARVDAGSVTDEDAIAPPVGLFVEAEIDGLELDNVVVLPRSALRNGDSVLVVDPENIMRSRRVEVVAAGSAVRLAPSKPFGT